VKTPPVGQSSLFAVVRNIRSAYSNSAARADGAAGTSNTGEAIDPRSLIVLR
jgi:hypothetical protein